MLRYILLGLCLTPLISQAEVACLEGPQGGKCHTVDVNGEVFKTAEPTRVTTVTLPTTQSIKPALKQQRRINTLIPLSPNKQLANKQPPLRKNVPQITTAERRIRQRAQLIEARFMRRQAMTNVSQLSDNNHSYIRHKP